MLSKASLQSFLVSLLLLTPALTGCQLLKTAGFIRSGKTTVQAVRDAGTPAVLNTSTAGESVILPVGTKISTTETERLPARPATAEEAAKPELPATKVTVVELSKDTEWKRTEATVQANTGAVDTSVALHRIDVASRIWLLWVAIGCGIAGIVLKSMLPAWPGLSNGLLIAAPAAFAAWKFADVPSWAWALVLGVVALLALGYKRAEWDKNGDGVPDILQK